MGCEPVGLGDRVQGGEAVNCPKCGAPQLKRFHNAFECGSANAGWHYQSNECQRREAFLRLEAERDALQARVKRLEEAGEACHAALGFADDDIREHLQVANYNLNGLLNTGDKIAKPDQPKLIHQSGIDESLKVREIIRSTRLAWRRCATW